MSAVDPCQLCAWGSRPWLGRQPRNLRGRCRRSSVHAWTIGVMPGACARSVETWEDDTYNDRRDPDQTPAALARKRRERRERRR